MTSEIVLHQSAGFISPVVDVQSALVRFQAMKDFIDHGLRVGCDFGVIPGTNKPTLLKPGAEKLANFFGLAPRFEIVEKELDWLGTDHAGEQFFYFHYRCRLMKADTLAAEGEGSANSFEKKYRWRSGERVCPKCGKPTIIAGKKEYGGGFICFAKKGGCGAKFGDNDTTITGQQTGQVKNPDIADIVNTLQKMAQKRAYVAAVLLAVNGSEYFTQDVEDFIDGSYTVEPQQAEQPTAKTTPPTNGNGKPAQPSRAEQAAPEEPLAEANPFDEPVNNTTPRTDKQEQVIAHMVAWTNLARPHVVNTLAKCKLTASATIEDFETWWNLYRGERSLKKSSDEAAQFANDTMLNPAQPA